MTSLPDCAALAKLPVVELEEELRLFLEPMTQRLPDQRLRRVCELLVQGILAAKSPRITAAAKGVARSEAGTWPLARRCYRFLRNDRFSDRDLLKGVGALARRIASQ